MIGSFALIGAGDLWAATRSATDLSIWPVVGPLGANAVPGNPLKAPAFAALDYAYAVGYVVRGVAALAAALALAGLRGTADRPLVTEESPAG